MIYKVSKHPKLFQMITALIHYHQSFENKRLLSTFCQMLSISPCFWFTFLSNLDINRKVACLFNEGGGLISRSLLLCYLWIRVEMTCELLLLYKMYGVCFDDNSQNNIMSDIDKHHSDSYSCPGASVHKNFSIGIIIEGSWTNPNFDTWWANTNWW